VLTGTDTTSSNVRVAMDGSDATTVTWETNAGGNAGSGDLKSVTRNSPSGDWGTAQTAVSSIADSDDSGPLTGPNGDVTYVWAGWSASATTPAVTGR
jgi:hypothetical protein